MIQYETLSYSRPTSLARRALRRAIKVLDRQKTLDTLRRALGLYPRRSLVIFNYHRVLRQEPKSPSRDSRDSIDHGVISATSMEFAEQIRLIRELGTPIDLGALCAALSGEAPLPKGAVLVTFDDGYRDNYEIALPILSAYKVPAVFFLSTGYIGTSVLPWWDRIAHVVRETRVSLLHLRYPLALSLPLGPAGENRASVRKILLRLVKQVYNLDLPRFFAELEAAAEVQVEEASLSHKLFMDWDEVRKMHQEGMELGAHTCTHRVLQTLPLHEARTELVSCREKIHREVGVVPRAIAYPVGYPLSYQLRSLVSEAGYEVGFMFRPGSVPLDCSSVDRYNLPRYAVMPGAGGETWFKVTLLAPFFSR